jgi:uncharacterized protein
VTELLEQLLVLQDRDRRIAELNQEAQDIPARKKDIEDQLSGTRGACEREEGELAKTRARLKEIEIEVESRKEKIKRLRQQQFEIKTNTEYRALEKEIIAINQDIRSLEDRELGVMEAQETQKAVLEQLRETLKEESEHIQEDLDELDERLRALEEERAEAEREREEALQGVKDPDALSRYQRVQSRFTTDAIVAIENGTCSGCRMQLPPQIIQDTKKSAGLESCSYCGRFLYWPE